MEHHSIFSTVMHALGGLAVTAGGLFISFAVKALPVVQLAGATAGLVAAITTTLWVRKQWKYHDQQISSQK